LHPCLWNTKCKEYSDKHIRNEAYSQLVEKCKERFPSADKDFVVKKFVASGFALGGNSKGFWTLKSLDLRHLYVPNLCYYDLLSFIADSEIPRRGKSNIDSHEETDDGNTDELSTHKCNNILTAYFVDKLLGLLIPYYIL
jgi:hypothetical protein